MKATDLIIGDWVQVPSLIDNVEHYDAWCKVKQLRDCDLDVIGFKELKYDEIVPIPLTPEILEKNGWECEYFGKRQEWWLDKTKFPIVGYSTNDTLHHNGIVLKYVHELQHALKLCKIEKEIVL